MLGALTWFTLHLALILSTLYSAIKEEDAALSTPGRHSIEGEQGVRVDGRGALSTPGCQSIERERGVRVEEYMGVGVGLIA